MGFRLTRPPPLKENDVKRACVDLLRARGYWVRRHNVGLFKTPDGRWHKEGEKGEPDYVALHERYPGFLMEVKRPGGQLRPEQVQKVLELRMGYRLAVAVVDSAETLIEWLGAHEKR